ncbi:hypothetical protein CLF_108276 [Clonorchis sinensis]|uniref:Uncharacterized protein n=1 Tax=Clonorchis sinensis TaxID=79923 RepID=G7YHV0_CLOSI|nr:hypothetical protein CLF_108276 [Clonorchis sinensis]
MVETPRVKDVPKIYANVDDSFDARPVRKVTPTTSDCDGVHRSLKHRIIKSLSNDRTLNPAVLNETSKLVRRQQQKSMIQRDKAADPDGLHPSLFEEGGAFLAALTISLYWDKFSNRDTLLKVQQTLAMSGYQVCPLKLMSHMSALYGTRMDGSSDLGAPSIPEQTKRDGRPRAPSSSRLFDERGTGRPHSRDHMNYADRSRPASRYDAHTTRSNSLYRPTSSHGSASSMNPY